MKTLGLSAALLAFMFTAPASAVGLCNCCSDGTTPQACASACAPVKPAEGQCVATVDYAGASGIETDKNPLYDVPLQNVWLGSPSRRQLEDFRQLLEAARKGAESDRRAALKAFRRGKIDRAEADLRAKRYNGAMVNYYLGAKAYTSAFSLTD